MLPKTNIALKFAHFTISPENTKHLKKYKEYLKLSADSIVVSIIAFHEIQIQRKQWTWVRVPVGASHLTKRIMIKKWDAA